MAKYFLRSCRERTRSYRGRGLTYFRNQHYRDAVGDRIGMMLRANQTPVVTTQIAFVARTNQLLFEPRIELRSAIQHNDFPALTFFRTITSMEYSPSLCTRGSSMVWPASHLRAEITLASGMLRLIKGSRPTVSGAS